MSVKNILILLSLTPFFAKADCVGFRCASYDFSSPVIITNSTTNPGLTVMGGNVGIGTTTPAKKLSVVGVIQSTTGGFLFPDGSLQTTAAVNNNSPSPWVDSGTQISYTNGNVGIGTNTPISALDISAGSNSILHVAGSSTPSTPVQGAYISWNALTGGTGETDFINNQGLGSGGFAFMNTPLSGTPKTTLMYITGSGDLGLGTTNPQAKLHVNGPAIATSFNGMTSYNKSGNNGTVSCNTFCQNVNNYWGADHGSCLAAKAVNNVRYYSCTDVPGVGVGGGQLMCLCTTF